MFGKKKNPQLEALKSTIKKTIRDRSIKNERTNSLIDRIRRATSFNALRSTLEHTEYWELVKDLFPSN